MTDMPEQDENTPMAETPSGPTRGQRARAELIDWTKSIVAALLLSLVLKATVVQSYVIPTGSMEPTIQPKDRVFGNRFIYRFHDPRRGDIVAFKPTDMVVKQRGSTESLLKRIIALPGDVVMVHDQKVYINGKPTYEPYLAEPPVYEMPARKVPSHMVFVMGDNRNDSYDSHYWGPLPIKNIQAKAFFRFWPIRRIGTLH